MKKSALCIVMATATQTCMAITLFGSPDCGRWSAANGLHKAWLAGFMSGLNAGLATDKEDPLYQIDSLEQMVQWMNNYCKQNPLERTSTGAYVLYQELQDRMKKKR